MGEKVLLIGSGAREHCIAWKLSLSPEVEVVYVVPGNAGTFYSGSGKIKQPCVQPPVSDYLALGKWCKSQTISMVVVGPEVPLADGIEDELTSQGISCFGPCAAAAQIEASKKFSKDFMIRQSIPTAKYKCFHKYEEACQHINSAPYKALVVKASGLAAGKGVIVAADAKEACAAAKEILEDNKFGDAGSTVIIEEYLEGEEISVLCFTDGHTVKVMPPAQDHKRLLDGDIGPNTGGMGAYSPCPQISKETLDFVESQVLNKTVTGLRHEGILYKGVLYAGLMLTDEGPKVLEFNCRFGDPECQVLLPLLANDLYSTMKACIDQTLKDTCVEWKISRSAVAVVMASAGYPGSYEKGKDISGIVEANLVKGISVFQAGTRLSASGQLETCGGRVLSVVGCSDDLQSSLDLALKGAALIGFEGSYHRQDIAHRGIAFLKKHCLTYAQSGVSISLGDALVKSITPIAKSTTRSGCVSNLGGFGGAFDISAAGYKNPILVSGADGVGTKLLLAHAFGYHKSVGVDLVAMCVNDILTHNAEPLFFLDYYACGKLSPEVATEVVAGVGQGCADAGCALIGGETAEMPGLYGEGVYDLGGFAVGAYEKGRDCPLPCIDLITPGDIVIGVTSSGLHSNGFSMVRKVVEISGLSLFDQAPFAMENLLGTELLRPTAIYSKQLLPIFRSEMGVKGVAHITGGGIVGNLPRVLPDKVAADLNADLWPIPPVFSWIAKVGNVHADEMLRTFNCGLGMCFVVDAKQADNIVLNCNQALASLHLNAMKVGEIVHKSEGVEQVAIRNIKKALNQATATFVTNGNGLQSELRKVNPAPPYQKESRMNVAVLISGTGTNLQALIDYAALKKQDCSYHIKLVVSNKLKAFGLTRAQKSGLLTKVINHRLFSDRELFDKALDEVLVENNIDVICLAGFMRILSDWFVRKWKGKILNIHPSLLPMFKGMNAHKQVLDAGVRVSGCSVHFVVEEMDGGAIIAQETTPVHPWDTIESLQDRVKLIEHKTYPRALELVANGQAILDSDKNEVVWNVEKK